MTERYQRFAGIAIGISINNGIYIDAVGKGFDGREISKGISIHESFFVPWQFINNLNTENLRNYRCFLIKDKEYTISRIKRINFLKSIGYKEIEINNWIPEKYEEISNFIWEDVIENVIIKAYSIRDKLLLYNLCEFVISGHTEGRKYMPWQIYDKTRFRCVN